MFITFLLSTNIKRGLWILIKDYNNHNNNKKVITV